MARRRERQQGPTTAEEDNPTENATGDARGPYGFGRPAHGSGDSSVYEFRPEENTRTLPHDKKQRWRVSG